MPRTPRCRRIQAFPDYWSFAPEDGGQAETITMTLDEYECIRLMDREKLTQEQCAQRMGIARTTVTGIYDSARSKLAEALVDGKTLRIGGGSYQLNHQGTRHIDMKGDQCIRFSSRNDSMRTRRSNVLQSRMISLKSLSGCWGKWRILSPRMVSTVTPRALAMFTRFSMLMPFVPLSSWLMYAVDVPIFSASICWVMSALFLSLWIRRPMVK